MYAYIQLSGEDMETTPSHGSVEGEKRGRIQRFTWPWRGKASIKVRVGEVASGSVGPLREDEVEGEVWEWTQHSEQGCRAGMANPRASRQLARDANWGRPLGVRLCGLEAGPPGTVGSFLFMIWAGQVAPLDPWWGRGGQSLCQDRSLAKSQARR